MRILKDLLHLVFPNTCAGCEENLVTGEVEICLDCLSDIEETNYHTFHNDNELFYRFAGKVPLDGAASLYYFTKGGKLQKIIAQLKYHHQRKIGVFLGEYYARRLKGSDLIAGASAIVPVPLHKKRLNERGYNQAAEFAKGLSKVLNIPVLEKGMTRIKATATQTRKGKEERWENMQEVFDVPKPLSGKIILVDDVITTGATLEACLRCLHEQEIKPQSTVVLSIGCTKKD